MNADMRRVRDTIILARFKAGDPKTVIAKLVGLSPPHVHQLLIDYGEMPASEGDRQRRAIWRRETAGARQALFAIGIHR